MLLRSHTVLSALLLCVAWSCAPLSRPTVQAPNCAPAPLPECVPAQYTDAPFDTSSSKYLPSRLYIRIEPVRGLSTTETDEFGLVLSDSLQGWSTSDIGEIQNIFLADVASVDVNQDVLIDEGLIGAIALKDRGEHFAGFVSSQAREGQSDIVRVVVQDQSVRVTETLDILNDPERWDSHPALTPDGSILIFASDRHGGFGGTDLWYSMYVDGEFTEPKNCGPTINTPCHEITPFVTPDGTLLFSSNGHPSVGGYDLHSASMRVVQAGNANIVEFDTPVNLQPPINTTGDELFPSRNQRERYPLYYSSDQREAGDFDVYVAHELPRPDIETVTLNRDIDISTTLENDKIIPHDVVVVREDSTAVVKDEVIVVADSSELVDSATTADPSTERITVRGSVRTDNDQPVADATVRVSALPKRELLAETATDARGEYEVETKSADSLEVEISHPELFPSVQVVVPDQEVVTAPVTALRNSMQLRIHFPTDDHSDPYEQVLDSNGVASNKAWSQELDKVARDLLQYQHEIDRVVLVGHTDDAASAAYNKALGQRRVEFVVQQLVSRGVPASMLEAQSAGESELLPRRTGESVQQWRLRCRRVELARIVR